jgi:cytochrome c oxidase subunit 3
MALTILGGLGFLGCQAWEWTTLIGKEHMSVTTNPFGTHTVDGVYLGPDGKESAETFVAGKSYLMHKIDIGPADHLEETGDAGHEGSGIIDLAHAGVTTPNASTDIIADHANPANVADSVAHTSDTASAHPAQDEVEAREGGAPGEGTGHQKDVAHGESDEGHGAAHYPGPGDYPDAFVDERGYIHRKYIASSGEQAGLVQMEEFGPKAFGALFFFITGFHGFHVFSGVIFLLIIMINVMSGIYVARRNGNEMVEKIGLYWHFVDLVWVFVFLVFYLL